jgi:hypothetical protein
MIEKKEQLLGDFRNKAQAFFDNPNLLTGIDLDDAAVTLKRYVLSMMHDEELGSILARFQKPIRALDTAALRELVAQVEQRIGD